jgi:hypothetical protein
MNILYDNARKHFAMGNIRWKSTGGDTIRFFFVNTIYEFDKVNHETLADIPGIYRYGRSGQTFIDGFEMIINDPIGGICDAQDITITGLQAGLQIGSIVIYKEGTSDADSLLISSLNIGSGMPFISDGTDIHIEWNNTPIRLFRI